MKDKLNFYISSKVKAKFPDLDEVVMPVYGVNTKTDESILSATDFQNSLGKMSDEEFYSQEELQFFRNFCEDLKIDLKKYPPSVEFLFKRFQNAGKVPHVNNVVDSANKVAVETLVATGVFDLDKIKGDLVLRFSKENEEFKPLGGDTESLPAGLVVIADDEKILNLFPFRDSIYQKITEETKNVLILADKMPEGSIDRVENAVIKVGQYLEKYCGGKAGETSTTILKEDKSLVITIEDLEKDKSQKKRRVFSATRATGRLHLGNYLGAVKGYLALQNDPRFECVFMVVDLHTITTPFDHETLAAASREIIIDYLACGLDPEKVVVTTQSMVPEHPYLSFLFSAVVSVARMQHLPTFKEKVKQHPDNVTMALLNYPILMAADILVYKGSLVPVGIDQEPHLEVAREIARKMNDRFGTDFPEPIRFATKGEYVPSLLGEGKMSKSVEGSSIGLVDDLETIKKKLSVAPTDSGHGDKVPEKGGVANLLKFVELFEGAEKRKEYESKYLGGGIRYGDLKPELAEAIYKELKPIQEKRKYFEQNPDEVDRIIEGGAIKARKIANETLKEVKQKMGFIT